jgi:transcriptional regulator with XRE-family HTH domain
MTKERLRSAMDRCGLTPEKAARVAGVDPKTVQRWMSGRVPHPRHRFALANELGENEEYIWPESRRTRLDAGNAAAELIAAYPYRADVDPSRWWDLITRAERQIDLLGFTLYFLPHQHPQLIDTLLGKVESGCKVRICIADPASEHVRWRDAEEQEAITLVARITSSLQAFEPLTRHHATELRLQNAPLYNSVFRFDDEMFVTPHLYGIPGRSAPLMHLRRLGPNGMFSRFTAHFEGVWGSSAPMRNDRAAAG